tara:strand:+ start:25 stop:675 length:651 start_codon:yes stop_codon:yes gene_type:complete
MTKCNTKIKFPIDKGSDWKIFLIKELKKLEKAAIDIDSGPVLIKIRDLIYLNSICKSFGHKLNSLTSSRPETVVSANSLAIDSKLSLVTPEDDEIGCNYLNEGEKSAQKNIVFHVGTVRSGTHIKSEGDLLIVGDVNPGAIVSANGNVMIWGKLLGIAHAGKEGDKNAKVSALALKPVQLRIANLVAKGPKEVQQTGMAEQAEISNGLILINPLCP